MNYTRLSILSVALVVSASAAALLPASSGNPVAAAWRDQKMYYPSGGALRYYVLPGEMLGVFGRNFAPLERVDLVSVGNGILASFTTDANGHFRRENVLPIPSLGTESSFSYRLVGRTSGTSVPFTVKIGQFYPVISPSSYYIDKGSTFSVRGERFAPGELVTLSVQSQAVLRKAADANGNVTFGVVTAPGTGQSFAISARGALSGNGSQRTIHLAE